MKEGREQLTRNEPKPEIPSGAASTTESLLLVKGFDNSCSLGVGKVLCWLKYLIKLRL